jgi:perosamine synthetase
MESSWISSKGFFLEKFEAAFAEYVGAKHALAVNTGTAACHLAALICDLGSKNDEVIVPASTYIATANAVKYVGATPIFVDVDKSTWNINVEEVEKAINKRTKAIFCTHLFGVPCQMNELMDLCVRYKLILLEDSCEAISATYNGQHVGTFGTVGCFSFFGNKTLTTGEGGMVVTNESEVYQKLRLYQGQGQTEQYYHTVVGYNYRMTNVAAAIGLAQLERVEEIVSEKKRVFDAYRSLLKVETQQESLPNVDAIGGHWMMVVKVNDAKRLQTALSQNGIDSRPMFYAVPDLPPYRDNSCYCPMARMLRNTCLMLPSYPELTNSQVEYICSVVNKYV